VKASFLLATIVALLCSLTPVRAQTIYPTRWCRVYDDTALIQIPAVRNSHAILSAQAIGAIVEAAAHYLWSILNFLAYTR
jgi:hypothetical protein